MKFDVGLVTRAIAGDRKALEELWPKAVEQAWREIQHCCAKNPHITRQDREDYLQEVMVVLQERMPTIREPEKFAGFVASVTARYVANSGRTAGRRRRLEAEARKPLEASDGQVDGAQDEIVYVREMVNQLKPRLTPLQGRAFDKQIVQEVLVDEAALHLDTSVNNLRVAMVEVRKAARQLLEEHRRLPSDEGEDDPQRSLPEPKKPKDS